MGLGRERERERTQKAKLFATETADLSSILRTHMAEGQNQLVKVVF